MYLVWIRFATAHDTGHLSTQICPNWKKRMASVKDHGIPFTGNYLEDKESLYEMWYRDCFAQEGVKLTDP